MMKFVINIIDYSKIIISYDPIELLISIDNNIHYVKIFAKIHDFERNIYAGDIWFSGEHDEYFSEKEFIIGNIILNSLDNKIGTICCINYQNNEK